MNAREGRAGCARRRSDCGRTPPHCLGSFRRWKAIRSRSPAILGFAMAVCSAAVDEAEKTAMAISCVPVEDDTTAVYKIMALKLLALVARDEAR